MNKNPEFKLPHPVVWWMIWAALLTGVCIIYFVIGGAQSSRPPETASTDSPVWMAAFVPFVIGAVIRWMVLPNAKDGRTAFVLFIVGLALSEAPAIIGVVVFPPHKTELFALSVLGILQFIPYFASKYDASST